MAEATTQPVPAAAGEATLDGGSYEVIRARLSAQAGKLRAAADALDAARRACFGGTSISVIGSERVRTENNCVPRDIVSVGAHLLFGYNVFLGLKSETVVSDVLSLHRFQQTPEGGWDLSAVPATEGGGFLADPRFVKDFQELFTYYKGTRLTTLARTETRLFVVFQTGQSEKDVRVFRFETRPDGTAVYLDARGEREYVFPKQHDFEWTVLGREQFVRGRHPHVNVIDTVFVECVGGDLTVKIENNTLTGKGIYAEPVEDKDQSLDDGEYAYAKLGALILLRVKPFREPEPRYLVFNERTEKVVRIDSIGEACQQLPEDQGIVFPGGFYLQTGEYKVFDGELDDLELMRAIRSPNGEDVLYAFHHRKDGRYLLLPYNLVKKEVVSPIAGHGYSLFADGKLVVFKTTSDEPTRVHPMQLWQTPFVSAEFAAAAPTDGSYLAKIGNAELVRGLSEAYTIERLAEAREPTRRTFEDLISACAKIVDAYPWLAHETVALAAPVAEVRSSALLVVDEFEKVRALRRKAEEAVAALQAESERVANGLRPEDFRAVEPFLQSLTALRRQRGTIVTARELKYVDRAALDRLEQQAIDGFSRVSLAAVEFLQKPEALQPLASKLSELSAKVPALEKTLQAEPLHAELAETNTGLELLSETIAGLTVGDPVVRAQILEGVGEVFGSCNRVRAALQNKVKELRSREGKAEFAAQFRLLAQNIDGALALADSPERCDEQLARLQVQLEELEGRFGELDEFVAQLEEKREELFTAFGAKKQNLLDERQRRAANLFSAAERLFQGIGRRSQTFKDEAELQSYFAADATVAKARNIAEQLAALKDSVKSDEVLSRLKTSQQEALRQLRDRLDLYEDGQSIIKLGEHRFTTNTQPLDLTVLPREDGLFLSLTGTDYLEAVDAPAVVAHEELWEQHLVSETKDVTRAEYLAASLLFDAEAGQGGLTLDTLTQAAGTDALARLVRERAAERFDEGYERGVHDADATQLLAKLLTLRAQAGRLRFPSRARAIAQLFFSNLQDPALKASLLRRAQSLGRLAQTFEGAAAAAALADSLVPAVAQLCASFGIDAAEAEQRLASGALVEELAAGARFSTSLEASALHRELLAELERRGQRAELEAELESLVARPAERWSLALAWVKGFAARSAPDRLPLCEEAAAILLTERQLDRDLSSASLTATLEGLLGGHPRIQHGKLELRLDEYTARLTRFTRERVPAYRAYRAALKALLEERRGKLRLDELRPKVLSSFVRNRLIAEVYLPLIGKNLAKQLGAAGENKRTDRMGLLLLLSPPGYGKTTLMEYVASRLGLVFVKVNGPALGHGVVSIDPAEAPNATSRQEVERINLGLEMGNNVMLYLDDIQHCSPELLQKFISLCDGQRRIEGVWKGRSRTYDLRGKKFCVVMAGNPYTETGERFRIPDMLANRADTYNLGDVLGGKQEVFSLSYVENALTSNPATQILATKDARELHALLRMAKGEEVPASELQSSLSGVEVQEIVAVLQRLLKVQQTLGKVNALYVSSAAQDDRFRTEPPFKLQGSYRNMNKLAEKVASAMNDDELEQLIDDHYAAESQTLTTAAESNLLKLAELRGRQSPEQQRRWEELKKGFARVLTTGGADDDPVVRVTGTLALLGERLGAIQEAVTAAAGRPHPPAPVVNVAAPVVHVPAAAAPVVNVAAPAVNVAAAAAPVVNLSLPKQAPPVVNVQAAPAAAAAAPGQTLAGPELLQRLDALREAITGAAASLSLSAKAQVELAKRARAAPAAAPGVPSSAAQPAVQFDVPGDLEKQLVLIEHALLPVARAAQRNLQSGGAQLQAIKVWQRVSEALELLRVLLPADHDPVAAARNLAEHEGE